MRPRFWTIRTDQTYRSVPKRYHWVVATEIAGADSSLATTHGCGHLASHGDPWWHGLPFIALTLFLLALPPLLLLVFGKRAEAFLPKARDWMSTNSWIVNEIVILLFVAITISSIAG